ncbi:TrmH family RNA methyltransferase [Candidatus Jorgensenbacteria bacterium]|nr:TrmH family RNA methyltransferase [Candidatus Jorgensenbacteria bacterium]
MIEIVALLHNIRSIHNVGSIFRTADGAGVKKLYLGGITPAPVDRLGKSRPQLTKVSLGAENYVAWERVVSTTRIIDKLKKDGFHIIAVEQDKKSIPYGDFKSSKFNKAALVMGNEVRGLPKSILRRADTILEIPMYGHKESLNVSVAFGIVVYSFSR